MNTGASRNLKEFLLKAERYCAYRERCSYEIRAKMKEIGANSEEIEEIIKSLQENDFLSDERFARLFTSGKFRIKKWGKHKIKAELKMKKIPESFINDALDQVDEEEYEATIEHLIQKKSKTVKSKNARDKNQKVGMYLLSKGFESELIWKKLKS